MFQTEKIPEQIIKKYKKFKKNTFTFTVITSCFFDFQLVEILHVNMSGRALILFLK